ncbi:hypothetical protein Tco_0379256 [Tanacetum coccineum]
MMELQDMSLAGETQLVADTVYNEKVLHKNVNVVERDNTVEQLLMTVVDNEWDCTEIDGWFDMKGREES